MRIDLKKSKISFGIFLVSSITLLIANMTKYPTRFRREIIEYGSDFMSMRDYNVDILFISFSYESVFTFLLLIIAFSIYLFLYKNDKELKVLYSTIKHKVKNSTTMKMDLLKSKIQAYSNKMHSKKKSEQKEKSDKSELTHRDSYSGFLIRVIAFGIDYLILFCIVSFVWAIFNLPIPFSYKETSFQNLVIFKHPIVFVFHWLYYALFESSLLMASPGKRVVGIRVADVNYKRISFANATGRYIGKYISAGIFCFGFLMIIFTKRKQGLHDIINKTYVLEGNSPYKKSRVLVWSIVLTSVILFSISMEIPPNTEQIDTVNRAIEIIKKDNVKKTIKYSFIEFECSNDWEVNFEEIEKDLLYKVNCINEKSKSFISLSVAIGQFDIDNWIEITKEDMYSSSILSGTKFDVNQKSKYLNYNSVSTAFSISKFDKNYFGKVISFRTNDKTILIIKETNALKKIDSEFILIEKSLKFK